MDIFELAKRDAEMVYSEKQNDDGINGINQKGEPEAQEIPTKSDDIRARAFALISNAYARAADLFNQVPDPYRRKSAKAWLCSDQCHQVEDALNRQYHLAVAAAEGSPERIDAMQKLDEGTHWWLKTVAGKMGVRI